MKKGISFKLIVPTAGLIALSVMIACFIIAYFNYNQYLDDAHSEQNEKIKDIDDIIGSNYSNILNLVHSSINLIKIQAESKGTIQKGENINILGQYAPNLYFGSYSIANNHDFVDKVQLINKSTATIFSLSGNNFVRISTNITDNDGKRAIGTILSHNSPAYLKLISGESFYGIVEILGNKYITGYEPIKINNNVVGAYFSGYPLSVLESINKDINESKIFDNGWVALYNSDNKPISFSKSADKSQIEKLIKDKPDNWDIISKKIGETGFIVYSAFPKSDVSSRIFNLLLYLIITAIIGVSLMIAIFYYVSKVLIIRPISILENAANKIAKGDLNFDLDYKGNDEIGILALSFNKVSENLKKMNSEIKSLIEAAEYGKLDIRGNSDNLEGTYKDIIIGFNGALNSITSPLNVAAEYVDKISNGQIPNKITDEYHGDFNEIKNNLNKCIDSINLLVEDTKSLSQAAINGNLNFRADLSKHNGEYLNIIKGVNFTLDRLVGLIDNMPIPVQIVDKELNVLYLNDKAKNIS